MTKIRQGGAARVFIFFLAAFSGLFIRPGRGQESAPVTTPPRAAVSTPADTGADSVTKSVVKIFSTVRYPSPFKPWTKEQPTEITGSGVVIEGHRILTCAHVVSYASRVLVSGPEGSDRLSAKVEVMAPGIDLAVLRLDDDSFFNTHPPLAREKTLPEIRDTVMAYGYPIGGGLSITKGIVSRIEFASYNYPVAGLRIQVDAAINHGNSGGPAVVGNKMIGLAFSVQNNTQNIGYIIPCEEIELFLNGIVDGHYDGKPELFAECQSLGNATLKSFLKLNKSVSGVIVHKPNNVTDSSGALKEWDVITHIGPVAIDDSGMVKLGDNLHAFFKYEVQKLSHNGTVPLTILRDGKQMTLEVPTATHRELVIPGLDGTYPSYFIYGPIVLSETTDQFVSALMRGALGGTAMGVLSVSGSPLVKRMGETPAFEGERLVVVSSPLFPHKLSEGYGNPMFSVVKSVNGIPVKNLKHLVEILRDTKDEFIVFEFDNRNGQTVVFRRAAAVAATDEILTDNDLRTQGSADMLSVWNNRAAR